MLSSCFFVFQKYQGGATRIYQNMKIQGIYINLQNRRIDVRKAQLLLRKLYTMPEILLLRTKIGVSTPSKKLLLSTIAHLQQ